MSSMSFKLRREMATATIVHAWYAQAQNAKQRAFLLLRMYAMRRKTADLRADAMRRRQEQDGKYADAIAALETKLRLDLGKSREKHAEEVRKIQSSHSGELRRAKSAV